MFYQASKDFAIDLQIPIDVALKISVSSNYLVVSYMSTADLHYCIVKRSEPILSNGSSIYKKIWSVDDPEYCLPGYKLLNAETAITRQNIIELFGQFTTKQEAISCFTQAFESRKQMVLKF